MPRVHLAKSLHILHHLTTHHRGTGSQCRGSLRSSLGDHWKALQVQLGTSSRIFCNFAFVSYCFTPDLLETLQKTAIKRCQLSQLRVFVVCPEHANMFNILRKPQNISKWFSFTSPSLLFLPAWNYVLETIWPIPILLDFFLKLLSEIDLPHLTKSLPRTWIGFSRSHVCSQMRVLRVLASLSRLAAWKGPEIPENAGARLSGFGHLHARTIRRIPLEPLFLDVGCSCGCCYASFRLDHFSSKLLWSVWTTLNMLNPIHASLNASSSHPITASLTICGAWRRSQSILA